MESRTLELGGTFLAFREAGRGRPVVLLPALDEGSFVYALQLAEPERIGRVLALDHIGSSGSDRPALRYEPVDYLRFAARFIDKTVDSAALVCVHGDAAPLGIALALSRPEKVSGLVLTNPELPRPSKPRGGAAVAGDFAPLPLADVLAGLKASFDLRRRLRQIAAAGRGKHELVRYGAIRETAMRPGYKAVAARRRRHADLWSEWVSRAGELKVPTRIVVGRAYLRRCAPSLAVLRRELAGVEVVTIEGAGRYPMIETPDAFLQALAL